MSWLQDNWLTLLLVLVLMGLMFKGPILSILYKINQITPHQLAEMLAHKPPPLLIDVRTAAEFNTDGRIEHAILVPLSDLSRRAPEMFKQYPGREVAVICRSGNRSIMGSVGLKKAGFAKVYNVTGGMLNWQSQGYKVRR
ncbi:Rhodanese domain protein [Magnetococcus marinus MC-1]|uniref:Rhodanese domain protein n=1 Tax=Magnetococcus marinus (strain ATCC BAA-1437 / JCM 17883 / MC-1) TaxID=156889 RepID=A0L4T7_MAGMM|nr:rhodanese-like domain-containing protein [Magnetococcus marinus]ABK42980.1 Rhodanese domain protein [Magnetococcus marinus MC-1]